MFTSAYRPPSVSAAESIAARAAAPSARSTPPNARDIVAGAFAKSIAATFAPFAARRCTTARPSAPNAPVTMHPLPSSVICCSSSLKYSLSLPEGERVEGSHQMAGEPLLLIDDPRPHVRRLTLNRPEKRNALSNELRGEIFAALKAADRDDAVRVTIIRGSGFCFSAGYDLWWAVTEFPNSFRAST